VRFARDIYGFDLPLARALDAAPSPARSVEAKRRHHVVKAGQAIVKAKPRLRRRRRLRRAFGFGDTSEFDPFLLLDDFRNETPRTTSPASPGTRTAASRPSLRAVRTVDHGDSLGNRGTIGAVTCSG